MRVLHVASGDLWAGAEVMLHALATAQSRSQDTAVAVLLFNEGKLAHKLRSAGMQVFIHPEQRLNSLRLLMRTRRTVRTFKPDIVHTHRIKEDVIGALATFPSGRGIRLVRTVHGADEVTRASVARRLIAALHDACIRSAFSRSFAVSAPLAEQLTLQYGPDRVACVPNGIDLAPLSSHRRRVDERRAQGPVHIGFIGRMVPIKRVDLFLGAAAILVAEQPRAFRFTIYGDGPESERLKSLAARLQVSHAVTFAGFTSEIIPKMQDLDMLFLTSDSEGLPMVVLEAMALGVPVVVPSVGELPEVLDHGRCGTLVGRQEPEAYALAARSYLADAQPFERKAESALRRVIDSYSADACAAAYKREYLRTLGRGPADLSEVS
jgi:glycosyltransferase involved in cell wall biosynthesis